MLKRVNKNTAGSTAEITKRVVLINTVVFVSAAVTGYVVMAFEMLIGNYLNPYFGSSIVTWGAVISTVLAALSLGYFLGGSLADRFPHGTVIGFLLYGSAVYFALIPPIADSLLLLVTTGISDARYATLVAAILFAIPLVPLGMYCPFAIRITMPDREHAGISAGRVYGVSTIGSIVGTLSVAFYLVLYLGSRNITLLLATLTFAVGSLNLMISRWRLLHD